MTTEANGKHKAWKLWKQPNIQKLQQHLSPWCLSTHETGANLLNASLIAVLIAYAAKFCLIAFFGIIFIHFACFFLGVA